MNYVKKYEMVYNRQHYTVVANDLIKGKQAMTLQCARLIRLMITQIVKEDKDLKTYTCKIKDLAEFLGVDSSNMYRDIYNICREAKQSIVEVSTGNINNARTKWKIFQWVDCAEYDGNGVITLKLSDDIKPYVVELDKYFTQYQLKNILEFKSFYAIRLYEIIKCDDGFTRESKSNLVFTIDDLRGFVGCEKKYQRISQFKEKVINTAVREINKKSDIYIVPYYIKTGRNITSVNFEIHSNFNTLLNSNSNT